MVYSVKALRPIVRTAIRVIDLWSAEAEELILGTIAQESHMGRYLVQIGGGPARGICQVEPKTERDNWNHYLKYRPARKELVTAATGLQDQDPLHLQIDPIYNIIMARIWYRRVPEKLPHRGDLDGQARYWDDHYNINPNHGFPADYVANYKRFIA